MKRLSLLYLLLLAVVFSCEEPKTDPVGPTVSTGTISNVTETTAQLSGNVTSDGGSPITAAGVVWATQQNPEVNLATKTVESALVFTSTITGLTGATKYFARAYATNKKGTSYGTQVEFTTVSPSPTLATLPTLTTVAVFDLQAQTARAGGMITSDGNASITARGVCWSTSPTPINTLTTKTTDGAGNGPFGSQMTGLSEGTKYYVRAYAVNSAGVAYGNEVIFNPVGAFTALDNVIASKMTSYGIPSLSIAIVRDEKLVYVKSYGISDKEANTAASNTDLYRLASVSKPITAIAILKLLENGNVSLDQKVFGATGILGNDFGTVPAGSGKDLITVRHLLEHKSGWTNTPNDPMFTDVSKTKAQVITDMLTTRNLTTTPGSTYYYLNFGYCVLGRVIEKVSGMTYENYVKSIVQGLGITSIKVGSNTLAQRAAFEVKYYQTEFSPYNINLERMDAAGGLISSATDLARLISRIDRNPTKPDILQASTLNNMYFGFTNWVHFGSLPGTSTILARINNQYSVAILVNTRTEANGDTILNDLNNSITPQITARTTWPGYDLF